MPFTRNGSARYFPSDAWDDMTVDLARAATTGTTAPTWTAIGTSAGGATVGGWGFDAAKTNEVYFNVQVPHGVKPGSTFYPHVHWCPTNTNTGVVRWEMTYSVCSVEGGAFPTPTDVITDVAASGVAYDHMLTGFGTITGAGSPSCAIACRLARIGGAGQDTYTGVAVVLFFDLHFARDRVGTTTPLPPWDT